MPGTRLTRVLAPLGAGVTGPEDVYARGVAIQIPRWQAWAKSAKAHLDRLLAAEERAVS